MSAELIRHYDLLIEEGNDPVLDPPALRAYMDKWDGEALFEQLSLGKEKSVLEIGCGTGRLAIRVAPLVRSFYGIDISPKTVEIAKKHLHFDNVSLVCGDFLEHQFDEKFDLVYSSLTFMHVEDKARAIDTVRGLLKRGGRFVLSIDKSRDIVLNYGTRSLKIYPDTPENITELLLRAGFTDVLNGETELAYLISATL